MIRDEGVSGSIDAAWVNFRMADHLGNDHAVSGTEFTSTKQHPIEPIHSLH